MKTRAILICIVSLLATAASVSFAATPGTPANKDKKIEDRGKFPDRRSDVSVLFEAGKGSYQSNNFSFDLGLDPDWQLNFGLNTQKSEGVTTATLFQAGANTYLSEGWRARFGLKADREPDAVSANGVYVGTGWIVSDLWDADLATEITLDGSVMMYRQGKDRLVQRVRGNVIPYSSLSVGVTQELSQVV